MVKLRSHIWSLVLHRKVSFWVIICFNENVIVSEEHKLISTCYCVWSLLWNCFIVKVGSKSMRSLRELLSAATKCFHIKFYSLRQNNSTWMSFFLAMNYHFFCFWLLTMIFVVLKVVDVEAWSLYSFSFLDFY